MADPTAQRVWDAALGQLQIHVTRPNYDTWLKDTRGLRIEDGCFVVGVPTEFVKEMLGTRMRGLVSQTVGGILGSPTEVSFEIITANGNGNGQSANGHAPANGNGRSAPPPADEMALAEASPVHSIISSPLLRQRLNPKYTFRSFVIADSNRIAAAAALAAAERPGEDYNPLFIYSSPGLGKTHLLQAIALRAGQAGRNALYVTSEQFVNDFVTSIAQGRGDEFRRRYRSVQLLLMDDIQFLAGKGRTQEEFFYTFNDLHSNGCQVVIASDRPPSAIAGLEARLASRFQWGLVADITPPDEETRLAILLAKSRDQRIELGPEVAKYLSDRAQDNIRALEGCLNRVVAYARLTRSPITLDTATKALAALTPTIASPADPQAILESCSSYYNVPIQAITGKSRAKQIAEARHVAMYLLREDAELALKQIGLLLGHRDHSTVIHGVQKVARALINDPRLSAQLSEIRGQVSH
ncbi:MAG TPA: chromosomal replication initiator protein DnaA [Dehalococcoidia bacterium]|jgi:chromosomal replication initiator protein|nr:chromosomal replication initiator protein DnaA [Dehalococcoidia bacterium]